jgi:excisionase family DNA binding protein
VAELPLVLTVEEAADALRIGRTAAYEAVRRGDIPSVRICRSIRVPRHALEQMLGLENGDGPAAHRAVRETTTPHEREDRREESTAARRR